jgi:hypothetical protein
MHHTFSWMIALFMLSNFICEFLPHKTYHLGEGYKVLYIEFFFFNLLLDILGCLSGIHATSGRNETGDSG